MEAAQQPIMRTAGDNLLLMELSGMGSILYIVNYVATCVTDKSYSGRL